MDKKDKLCECCKRKFRRGICFTATEYADKLGWKDRWQIARNRKKIYICDKCCNVGMALIRNHLAVKTSSILDE